MGAAGGVKAAGDVYYLIHKPEKMMNKKNEVKVRKEQICFCFSHKI